MSCRMKNNGFYGLLGLAMKADCVVSGEYSVERTVKAGRARFVIIAKDASQNTKKKFTDMSEYYHIPYRIYGEKEAFGRAIGREERASAAVTDDHFANRLKELSTNH